MNLTNQNIYGEAGTYNWIFCAGDCRTKIESQDSDSDDDVLAIIDSDSDILETVEKTDIVEFLDDNNVGMIWKKVKYNGNFHVALEVNFRRESAERNFFLLSQIN